MHTALSITTSAVLPMSVTQERRSKDSIELIRVKRLKTCLATVQLYVYYLVYIKLWTYRFRNQIP